MCHSVLASVKHLVPEPKEHSGYSSVVIEPLDYHYGGERGREV